MWAEEIELFEVKGGRVIERFGNGIIPLGSKRLRARIERDRLKRQNPDVSSGGCDRPGVNA